MSTTSTENEQDQSNFSNSHNMMMLACILTGDYETGLWVENFFNMRASRPLRDQALDLRLRRKALERLGQVEEAFSTTEQEISLSRTVDMPIWLVSSLRSAGYFYLRHNKSELARKVFDEAIQISDRGSNDEDVVMRIWMQYERSKCTLASIEVDLALDQPHIAVWHVEQFEFQRGSFSYWKSNLFQALSRIASYEQKHGLPLTHGQSAHYWLDASVDASKTVDEWSGRLSASGEFLHLCTREMENVFHKAPTLHYPNTPDEYNTVRQAQALRLRAELSNNASDISKYTLQALKIEDKLFLDWPYYRAELWFLI